MKVKKFNESIRDQMTSIDTEKIVNQKIDEFMDSSNDRYGVISNLLDYLRENGFCSDNIDHNDLSNNIIEKINEDEFKELLKLTIKEFVE